MGEKLTDFGEEMKELLTDFGEEMKKLIKKGVEEAMEKAMDAIRQSVDWAMESQTTVKNKMGKDYADPSKLVTENDKGGKEIEVGGERTQAKEMSLNLVNPASTTLTLVSIFDNLNNKSRVEKLIDVNMEASQPSISAPQTFDEIPVKVYDVQIPATTLHAPNSVVFHVESVKRVLTSILSNELTKNYKEMVYNLHENEYGKVLVKPYVNYKNVMNGTNVVAVNFETKHDTALCYKIHEDMDVVKLADDEDLNDIIRQSLNPLRIIVKLNTERNLSLRPHGRSNGSSTTVRSQPLQPPLQVGNTTVSEVVNSLPGTFREALSKFSTDMGLDTSSPAGYLLILDFLEKMGLTYLKEDYNLCNNCFDNMGSEAEYIRMDLPLNYQNPGPFNFRNHNLVVRSPSLPLDHAKLDSCFILDVNILDGTIMTPLANFTKNWRMRNNGSLAWPHGTNLLWIGEEQISRIYLLLTVKESAVDVPTNLEARRRVTFFTKSLFMKMPCTPRVCKMLSFNVMTPCYSEVIVYSNSKSDCETKNEDGISILFYLQTIYPDEWDNVPERLNCEECERWDAEENIWQLRHWAPLRGQTLCRTIRGKKEESGSSKHTTITGATNDIPEISFDQKLDTFLHSDLGIRHNMTPFTPLFGTQNAVSHQKLLWLYLHPHFKLVKAQQVMKKAADLKRKDLFIRVDLKEGLLYMKVVSRFVYMKGGQKAASTQAYHRKDMEQLRVQVTIIDVSTSQKETENIGDFKFVSRKDVLSCYFEGSEKSNLQLPDNRGKAIAIMIEALKNFLTKAHKNCNLTGVVIPADGKVILFIDEIHLVLGAGRTEGSMDVANLFKSMLVRRPLHCIGATTLEEYRKYVEKDDAFERRFQQVYVAEPSVLDTINILWGLKERYEGHHGVRIKDSDQVRTEVLLQWQGLTPDEAMWEDMSLNDQRFPWFHLEDKVSLWERGNVMHPIEPRALHVCSMRDWKGRRVRTSNSRG